MFASAKALAIPSCLGTTRVVLQEEYNFRATSGQDARSSQIAIYLGSSGHVMQNRPDVLPARLSMDPWGGFRVDATRNFMRRRVSCLSSSQLRTQPPIDRNTRRCTESNVCSSTGVRNHACKPYRTAGVTTPSKSLMETYLSVRTLRRRANLCHATWQR